MSAAAWDGVVRLRPVSSRELVSHLGGVLSGATANLTLARFVPIEHAGFGDVAPLLASRFARYASAASARGALILADAALAAHVKPASALIWAHAHAAWAMAEILARHADVPDAPATFGEGGAVGPHVVFGPRVVVGARVRIDASSVIGRPGFGWALAPTGEMRAVPQLGGVVIEDDVVIGPLCTIDAGTLSPTRIARGAKLDAHVHVGHNCVIGEGSIVAAQSGFAGSVKVGRGVLVGGQVGVADHVTIGDGARIAAKSGVIGDVPAGATVAGYPAVPRAKWLRALAWAYRASRGPSSELTEP